MSCAWVKIEKLEPINLEDVISEEITIRNQVKEEKQCKNTAGMSTESVTTTAAIVVEDRLGKIGGVSNQNLDDDALMAKMLQIQFDKECDKELKCPQIYGNYQKAPLNFGFQSDGKEEEIISMQQEKVLDKLDLPDRAIIPIHYCGNKKLSDTQIITKHDIIMSGKKNANTDGQDDFISNLSIKAFNDLDIQSKCEQFKRHKLHNKNYFTKSVFRIDKSTQILLDEMINNHFLEQVNCIMKVGKEAFILHADRFPNVIGKREKCVVKMFKTDFFQFKLQEKYVKYNPNFKDKIDKQNMGKYSQLWAERERDNLIRLKNADIPCPEVITLKQHLLIMSFIGENYRPALTLKDANLSDQKFNDAYLQVIKAMKTMYEKENLIHGDLSEDNILWFKECCYFIDVGQAMAPTDVNAYNFLYRDCQKITDFFSKRVYFRYKLSVEQLFRYITGRPSFYLIDVV